MACLTAVSLLSKVEENRVVAAFRLCTKNGKAKPVTAASSLTHRHRRVKRGKRPTVALYLDELLIKYVNSKVDRSAFSHNGFPPVGPWHLVGATMDNTLD